MSKSKEIRLLKLNEAESSKAKMHYVYMNAFLLNYE